MSSGGTSQPLYKGGGAGRHAAGRPGPAAPLLGGLGAGRPAAGRPVLQGLFYKIFTKFLQKSPCRLAAGRSDAGGPGRQAAGYIPVNFENENIFL